MRIRVSMLRKAVLLILILVGTSHAAQFSVGVSPPVVEIGDVSPGEQKLVTFSIFTVSDESLLIYFKVEDGTLDFFSRGYGNFLYNFSEEPTSSWIELLKDPVEIDATGERVADRSWTDVTVLLKVPENAEPGYHVVALRPIPTTFGAVPGTGANVVTVTSVSILFNVEGPAKRGGTILDTTSSGHTNGLNIKTFFQNTGTTTISARSTNRVYDKNNALIGEFYSPRAYVKPGNIAALETPTSAMEEGEYTLNSIVTFTTGDSQKNSTVYVAEAPQEVGAAEEDNTLLIIFATIIIIALLAAVYRWLRERY